MCGRRVAGYGQSSHEAFRRMFERDKADLRALGVPIDVGPLDRWDDTPGYRIDPRRYDLPPLALEADEVAALALAVHATGLADVVGSGLLKLAVDAGEPAAAASRAPLPVAMPLDAPHLRALTDAVTQRLPVRFAYHPPGRPPAVRTVDPQALVNTRGRWYLVAHDHDRDAERSFRLDRITGDVQPAGEPGTAQPPDHAPGPHDVAPPPVPPPEPVTAEVLASEAVAWQVARHAADAGRPADGGTAFAVPVADLEGFLAWLLDLGTAVRLLGPESLRAELARHLHAVAAAHEAVA